MARLKTKIFDGIILQLSSELVDGVKVYTVTVESSNSDIPRLIINTTSFGRAVNIFNNWQAGLHNTCGGFV